MVVSSQVRKRQYEASVRREAYLARTDRPVKEGVSKRPKTTVIYASTLLKSSGGTVSQLLSIQASERSLLFLANTSAPTTGGFVAATISPLGLRLPADVTDPVIQAPRFWEPAKIHASVGLGTPTAKRSPWGTRVVKSKSQSYSAPVSATSANVTYDTLDARATAIFTTIKPNLGDLSYAEFYLSPEIFNGHKN